MIVGSIVTAAAFIFFVHQKRMARDERREQSRLAIETDRPARLSASSLWQEYTDRPNETKQRVNGRKVIVTGAVESELPIGNGQKFAIYKIPHGKGNVQATYTSNSNVPDATPDGMLSLVCGSVEFSAVLIELNHCLPNRDR